MSTTLSASTARELLARKLATALIDTRTRHHRRLMSYTTYQTHMQHLWAQVDRQGLRADVTKLMSD